MKNSRLRQVVMRVSAIPIGVMGIYILIMNLECVHVPHDPESWKYDSLVGVWLGDERDVWGWPFFFIRSFAEVTEYNQDAGFDPCGLTANVFCWAIMLGVSALPLMLAREIFKGIDSSEKSSAQKPDSG